MSRKSIVFDLDGTLIDSSGDIAWAANRVLGSLGKEPQSVDSVRNKIGSGVRVLLERLMPKATAEEIEEARIRFIKEYSAHTVVETVLYKGVSETLALLSDRGYVMAIVTNKPEVLVKPIIEKLDIARHFTVVVGGDTYPNRKPHPEPLVRAIESLGCSVNSTTYVGDSEIDAQTGRAAGTYTVGVSYGFGGGVDVVKSFGFDTVIDSMDKLVSSIG